MSAKTFEILKNSAGEYVAVRRGFSIFGFFFQWVWLLYIGLVFHGLLVGLAYVVLGNLIYGMKQDPTFVEYGLLAFVPGLIHPPYIENESLRVTFGMTRTVLFGLMVGFFGFRWQRQKYEMKGFARFQTVSALNEDDAIKVSRTRSLPAVP